MKTTLRERLKELGHYRNAWMLLAEILREMCVQQGVDLDQEYDPDEETVE